MLRLKIRKRNTNAGTAVPGCNWSVSMRCGIPFLSTVKQTTVLLATVSFDLHPEIKPKTIQHNYVRTRSKRAHEQTTFVCYRNSFRVITLAEGAGRTKTFGGAIAIFLCVSSFNRHIIALLAFSENNKSGSILIHGSLGFLRHYVSFLYIQVYLTSHAVY